MKCCTNSCGGLVLLCSLQAMKVVGGALRMGSSGKDEPLVVLQYLDPGGNIGGMVGAHVRRDAEIHRQEGGSQLGDQLLARIAFVTPFDAPVSRARRVPWLGPVCVTPISA